MNFIILCINLFKAAVELCTLCKRRNKECSYKVEKVCTGTPLKPKNCQDVKQYYCQAKKDEPKKVVIAPLRKVVAAPLKKVVAAPKKVVATPKRVVVVAPKKVVAKHKKVAKLEKKVIKLAKKADPKALKKALKKLL